MLKDNYKTHLENLRQLSDEYTEKIVSRIYNSIRLSDWETTEEDVLNLYWEGFEQNYKMTKQWLKDNYALEASLQPFISDFKTLTYHHDGIDIEERTKRKIENYKLNEVDPNTKLKVAVEIGRQTRTENKVFFFNLTKQVITEHYPAYKVFVSIDNIDGYEDCEEGGIPPLCEEYHDKIQHVCITELQDSDLPPYHPDCECFPVFEIIEET